MFSCHKKENKKFDCKECGKSIKYKKNFTRHKKEKSMNAYNFVCEECKRKFKRKCDLKRHENIHKRIKFECPLCNRFYSRKYKVTIHIKKFHKVYKHIHINN